MTTFATDDVPAIVPRTVAEATDPRDLQERVMLRHALDLLWHGGVNWHAAKAEALRRFPPPMNARDARRRRPSARGAPSVTPGGGLKWGARYYDEHGDRRFRGGFQTRSEAREWVNRKVDEVEALRSGAAACLYGRECSKYLNNIPGGSTHSSSFPATTATTGSRAPGELSPLGSGAPRRGHRAPGHPRLPPYVRRLVDRRGRSAVLPLADHGDIGSAD